MKRKLIAGALCFAMMGAAALPAQAQDVSVTYREPNRYTLSIPTSIDLNASKELSVSVSEVNLEPGAEIKISISAGISEQGVVSLVREDDETTTAVTTLSVDGAPVQPGVPFATFTSDASKTLTFSALSNSDGGEVKAGSYSGTITFKVDAPEQE